MDLLVPILIVAVLVAGGLAAYFLLESPKEPQVTFRLKPIADKTVLEGEVLTVDAVAEAEGLQGNVVYWLVEGPEDALDGDELGAVSRGSHPSLTDRGSLA